MVDLILFQKNYTKELTSVAPLLALLPKNLSWLVSEKAGKF